MKLDDKDYDEMDFTAVLVIDLVHQKTTWFPVDHQTLFHFDPTRKLIFVSKDQPSIDISGRVESLDLAGSRRGEACVLDMTLSPSKHFAGSLQEDGVDWWEVFDAASKRALLAFGCDKPGCKPGDREEDHYWNPVFDGQFIAVRSSVKGGKCDVFQAARSALVKSVPCDDLAVFDWSRDGRELITIESSKGRFRREVIN
jgi:hypothetical protein